MRYETTDRFGLAATMVIGSLLWAASAESAGLPNPVADYREVVKSTDLETYSAAALALRKWSIENDPSRRNPHSPALRTAL